MRITILSALSCLLLPLAACLASGQTGAGQGLCQEPPLPASNLTREQYLEQVSKQIGWGGERLARLASQGAPQFRLQGDVKQDNAKRRVVLWDVVRWVKGGHLPTRRQEIGDCVGFGAAQAVDYLQYVQVVLYGRKETPKPVWVPYHYACGRNAPECGAGRIRGPDGSIGAWQAKALQLYGVIAEDFPGLPPYSGAVAKQRAVRMPEQRLLDEGRKHLVQSIALVTTAAQARDSICNGYPLTIASNWGGLMEPPAVDGKLVNRRATTWQHQMCIVGYDGTGREPLWFVLNSWGPDAHGSPPDGSPPGGFWIRQSDLDYILRQDDVWALSDLRTGFEPRNLNVDGLTLRLLIGGRTYAFARSLFDSSGDDRSLRGDLVRLADDALSGGRVRALGLEDAFAFGRPAFVFAGRDLQEFPGGVFVPARPELFVRPALRVR